MENIFIKNRKGLNMALRLSINSENKKLVFLIHGLSSRKEYPHMLVMEEMFLKNGYNVVNMDATNSLNASDSDEKGITFTGHYEDLVDVVDWAKSQKFYTEPFALAGQSLGAQAVVYYATQYPTNTNFVISCAIPWLDGKIEIKQNKRTPRILEKGYYDQVSKSTGKTLRIYKNYLDDFEKYNFIPLVKNITAETHIICGLLDSQYHINNNKELYYLLTCKKSLQLLPDVPHDLANTPETKETFTKALEKIFDDYK